MGLDMYLYAEKYFASSPSWGTDRDREAVKNLVKMMDAEEVATEEEYRRQSASVRMEIAYWRKANEIHNYFVKNCADGVDNCQSVYIEIEQLKDLLDRCKKILDDNSLAQELLPTVSGFFFGGTVYDEWYFESIQETVKKLEKIIPQIEAHSDWDIYYEASW